MNRNCDNLYNMFIKDLEKLNKVIVRREPEITQIGKKSRFWSEGNGKHVWIKSKKEIN